MEDRRRKTEVAHFT